MLFLSENYVLKEDAIRIGSVWVKLSMVVFWVWQRGELFAILRILQSMDVLFFSVLFCDGLNPFPNNPTMCHSMAQLILGQHRPKNNLVVWNDITGYHRLYIAPKSSLA
jgi:hypothetical protein